MIKFLFDLKSLGKSLVINLAISALWYVLEFEQFGTLQLDRVCDNFVFFIYVVILWYVFHKFDEFKRRIYELRHNKDTKENN